MPEYIRLILNGTKYLMRYRAFKEHENNIIEDNLFFGYKNHIPDEKIKEYEK